MTTAPPPPDVALLNQRLEGLERKARRWRWACLVLLSATLIAVVEGTDWVRVRGCLVAREIVLRDDAGRVRAKLEAETPGLVLYDEEGREHARLQSRPDGTSRLSLLESGILRGEMGNRPDGSARICVIDDRHRIAAGLHVAPDGNGRIFLGGQPLPLPEPRDPTQLAATIGGDGPPRGAPADVAPAEMTSTGDPVRDPGEQPPIPGLPTPIRGRASASPPANEPGKVTPTGEC